MFTSGGSTISSKVDQDLDPSPDEVQVRDTSHNGENQALQFAKNSVKLPRNEADCFTGYSAISQDKNVVKYRVLERDQVPEDRGIKILLDAKEHCTPICLIVGSEYKWWPLAMRDSPPNEAAQMGNKSDTGRARYTVLGWYLVRHAWTELEPGEGRCPTLNSSGSQVGGVRLCVRWKFGFRWIEDQGAPWWITELERLPVMVNSPLGGAMPIHSQRCLQCNCVTQRIYFQGWFCAHPACRWFNFVSTRHQTSIHTDCS
jgi:phage FluMu protein Com